VALSFTGIRDNAKLAICGAVKLSWLLGAMGPIRLSLIQARIPCRFVGLEQADE